MSSEVRDYLDDLAGELEGKIRWVDDAGRKTEIISEYLTRVYSKARTDLKKELKAS